MPLELSCTNEEQIRVRANPVTSTGQPAELDGPLRVSVVSGDGSAVPGEDDREVILRSGSAVGPTVFLLEGDADLGPGESLVPDTVTLHVSQAAASNLGLVASAPEAKPAPEPEPEPTE